MGLQAALDYAARDDIKIFPCVERGKKPVTPNGFKAATTDTGRVRQWWTQNPNFNIGAPTGRINGFFVLDVDGANGEATLRELEKIHGTLPLTIQSTTGKGRHIFFKMPDLPLRNSAKKIGPGLDIRADGGYVILPPSVHANGNSYRWVQNGAHSFASAPDWLLAKIVERPKTDGTQRSASNDWRDLIIKGVHEGQRNETLKHLAGVLFFYLPQRDALVARELLHSINQTHFHPPLPRVEVDRTVNSIAGMQFNSRYGR